MVVHNARQQHNYFMKQRYTSLINRDPPEVRYNDDTFEPHPLGTRRCCDVKSTSLTLIVATTSCAQWAVFPMGERCHRPGRFYFHRHVIWACNSSCELKVGSDCCLTLHLLFWYYPMNIPEMGIICLPVFDQP